MLDAGILNILVLNICNRRAIGGIPMSLSSVQIGVSLCFFLNVGSVHSVLTVVYFCRIL